MSTEYSVNVFGMAARCKSPIIYVLLPAFLGIAYLATCASLYSFVHLFSIIEFSWINGVYWMIMLGTIGWIFSNASGSGGE